MTLEQLTFFIAPCAECARETLGHRVLAEPPEQGLRWACVLCDAPLDEHAERARWVDRDELDELGYFLAPEESPRHGDSGCRGGQCGVRHPEATS
jgi:hypothetical protein